MSDGTTVLVIDDSATIRKLVEMSMRGTSFHPAFAALGTDGIAQARTLRPAAILLDCVLPDCTGPEVCRQLAADARTRSIPVLIVSAKAASVRDEFRDLANVADFVPKPFTGPDLLRRIAAAIGGGPTSPVPRDHIERAAQILYARLRDGLAAMPTLVKQAGAAPPGPYLAKRLLTPEAVAGILGDLQRLHEELRVESADEPKDPLPSAAVLDRASGFSDRVRAARLGSNARRVLTLINGRHSLAEITRRAGLDAAVVRAIARELVDDGLLVDRASTAKPRPIVILEPDVQGFQQPFATLLEARPVAPALVPVTSVHEVVTMVRRVYPCLVVVNATGETSIVGKAARELRADATFSDVALVAVLDRAQPSDRDDLYSAGFDAVLNKPVIIGDLERFIAPCSPLQRKEDRWVRS